MTDVYAFDHFELQPDARRLLADGTPLPIGGRAFDLLMALVERRHRVVPHRELMELVWPGLPVEPSNLQVQVWALRKLLGADAIATVARRGYRFMREAVPRAATAPLAPGAGRGGPALAALATEQQALLARLDQARCLTLLGADARHRNAQAMATGAAHAQRHGHAVWYLDARQLVGLLKRPSTVRPDAADGVAVPLRLGPGRGLGWQLARARANGDLLVLLDAHQLLGPGLAGAGLRAGAVSHWVDGWLSELNGARLLLSAERPLGHPLEQLATVSGLWAARGATDAGADTPDRRRPAGVAAATEHTLRWRARGHAA